LYSYNAIGTQVHDIFRIFDGGCEKEKKVLSKVDGKINLGWVGSYLKAQIPKRFLIF
jgi:hypothetical protein